MNTGIQEAIKSPRKYAQILFYNYNETFIVHTFLVLSNQKKLQWKVGVIKGAQDFGDVQLGEIIDTLALLSSQWFITRE